MSNGPSKARFEEIFSNGKRVQGQFSRLCGLPGTGLVGFATSKKIGNRPQRNRVRRRFQAAYWQAKIDFSPPLDLVLIIGTSGASVGLTEAIEELQTLLEKMKTRWADDSECS